VTGSSDRFAALRAFLALLVDMLATLLRALFGNVAWTPPTWVAPIRARATAVGASAAANPKRTVGIALGAFAGLVAVLVGVKLWKERPQPVTTAFTVSAPPATDLRAERPEPNPVRVTFESSVAPLSEVNRIIDSGPTISPAIAGTWRWVGDRELRFTPTEDWPVGEEFTVSLRRPGLVASNITLEEKEFEFASAPFHYYVSTAEFYQDPIDPALKRVTMQLTFTHPVDTASIREHVSLKLSGGGGSILPTSRSIQFTVRADKTKLSATILSGPLNIPNLDATMQVSVEPGLKSSRGGPATDASWGTQVRVPGLYSLAVQSVELTLVRNERYEPEQVIVVSTSADVGEQDLQRGVQAWVLPIHKPGSPAAQRVRPYAWNTATEIDQAILDSGTPLPLAAIPTEREYASRVAFKYVADPGRYIYVRVAKNLRSFGGYVLGRAYDRTALVPTFPKEVKILGSGSLLSLEGDRKLSIYSRDVPGLLVEVGRVLPDQLQHLVSQSGLIFGGPEFNNYNFDESNLTSRRADSIALPPVGPGQAHYQPYDLTPYLASGGLPRGLFLISVQGYDPALKRAVGPTDRRLILVTDIGVLAKQGADGGQDLFVQSLRSGLPLAGVTVDVVGKNGLPVLSAESDGEGHVRFPDLSSFDREKSPVLYAAHRGTDLSFLPIEREDRMLDLSRFDVGGVTAPVQADQLTAYLFSDRGIYRPGDSLHIGMIVKPANWSASLAGIPLEAVITDARGLEVKRTRMRLSAQGFEEITYGTAETSPTGTWTIALHIVRDGRASSLLGSTTVRVKEFQPDRLTMTAHLSTEVTNGWVSPDELKARITLRNLFGTPAADRRVTARIELTPGLPLLRGFEDYRFSDPQVAKETFADELTPTTTNASGEAEFDLGLERYARATYRLRVITEGFEAGGGRGVTAEAGAVVSNQPFLIGFKADGDLRYLAKDSERSVDFVAVGSEGTRVAARGLKLLRIRIQYVSVLTRQYDGTYKYQSVRKEVPVDSAAFAIAATGASRPLPTAEPGDFAYLVKDSVGVVLSRVEYNVAGAANLTRSLERNAELQLTLAKADYEPGETIELQITAPYTGAGLITIERDRVYAYRWFRATTTSSVQRITLPAGLEGNGYVSVSFVRDVNSDEVFTTPLSFGVAPFSVSLDSRKTAITLEAPQLVKPGDRFRVHYATNRPSRIAVYAVDEGILQVAGYRTPDPLGFFFEKRALQVRTSQILDLILPEFARLMAASAPGGDAEGMLGRNLNPFKRRRDPPVAFWSGVRDAGPEGADFTFTVPDYFNGTLRVMAVAVNDATVGAAAAKSVVRGDFVLSPNVPLMVAPGDTFEVSVSVANNIQSSGAGAQIQVALQAPPSLQVIGPATTTLPIDAMREGSATFRLVAKDQLGNATLNFTTRLGDKSGKISASLSLRPAVPFRTSLAIGSLRSGRATAQVDRTLHTELRTVRAGVSVVPLGIARGLAQYLTTYPYGCTEQLVSQGVPAMVLSRRPEFGIRPAQANATLAKILDQLRARQNEEGAYGLWAANTHVDDYVSVYAQHFLLDAKERGFSVPTEVTTLGQRYLQQLAGSEGATLAEERTRAYAIYLLTRQGVVTTGVAMSLERRVRARYPNEWKEDVTGGFLAATYQLLRQETRANEIIDATSFGKRRANDYAFYDDGLTHDAILLYLTARHFPARLTDLRASAIDAIVGPIARGAYNTHSTAFAILALDAYVTAVGPEAAGRFTITEVLAGNARQNVALSEGTFPEGPVTAGAKSVEFVSEADVPAFYQLLQSGFDRVVPTQALSEGLEVFREYTDRSGKVVTEVAVGDEVQVHLRFRALGDGQIPSVALIDLLPGGFEVVEERPVEQEMAQRAPAPSSDEYSEGDEGYEGEGEGDGEGYAEDGWTATFGQAMGSWSPDYAEVREDRVNVYGVADQTAREFVYTLKATAVGSFAIPPAFGEGMYDRSVRAWSQPGRIVVRKAR
jgi:alpha-2-macroglobulin